MTENTGGTIEVTKYFGGYPITVIIRGDESDRVVLLDAMDATYGLCDIRDSTQDVACYLYDVLKQAFDVVSVEALGEIREGQVQ